MADQTDRDALAVVLHGACPFGNDHIARLVNYETGRKLAACPECFDIAAIVTASTWLADHDRQVQAKALRDAAEKADALPSLRSQAPGPLYGYERDHADSMDEGIEWTARWLRECADQIEGGR